VNFKKGFDWKAKVITSITNIQPQLEKIIRALIYLPEKYSDLKTSDKSLIKCLLSINMFLYYHIKETRLNNSQKTDYCSSTSCSMIDSCNTFVVLNSLKYSIIKMINLVEHYRCKNCLVLDSYENNIKIRIELYNNHNDYSIYDDKLIPLLDNLKPLEDIQNKMESNFDKNVSYDLNTLLLERVLSHNKGLLQNAKIMSTGKTSSIFNSPKETYDIEKIHEYQINLFKAIAFLF